MDIKTFTPGLGETHEVEVVMVESNMIVLKAVDSDEGYILPARFTKPPSVGAVGKITFVAGIGKADNHWEYESKPQ